MTTFTTSFDQFFSRLEAIRLDLANVGEAPEQLSADASRHYMAIDLLARDILLNAVLREWDIADSLKKKAKNERTLPFLVTVAEQYAPRGVEHSMLSRIVSEYHPLRNSIEHRGRQCTPSKAYEYLGAVETVLYSITGPTFPEGPHKPLHGLEGFTVVAAYGLAKTLMPNPWIIFHGKKEADYGYDNVLEFWRFGGDEWERIELLDIGTWNLVYIQLLQSRSALQQELLVWKRGGESMGVMSYEVLAVEDHKIVRLLSREGISGAHVVPRGLALEEWAGDRLIRFAWDGEAYVGSRAIRQAPCQISTQDIHYRVVGGKVIGPEEVKLKVGDKLRILRDDLELLIIRALGAGSDILPWHAEYYTAERVGETEITLIPNVYDSGNALRLRVKVQE